MKGPNAPYLYSLEYSGYKQSSQQSSYQNEPSSLQGTGIAMHYLEFINIKYTGADTGDFCKK